MGQCYSTYLQTKGVNEDLLIKLTNKYFKERDDVSKYLKAPRETIDEVYADLFTSGVSVETNGDSTIISSAFDASYGWHDVMTSWFEFCAKAFTNGDSLEIFPDEGESKTEIENGKATTRWLDWDEMARESPYYGKILERIQDEVKGLDEDFIDWVASELGEHGDDSGAIAEDYDSEVEDEELDPIPEELLNQVWNIIDNTEM